MPPTAAAGQLQQATPAPPPFRAGFHYERAQTPELPARKREQQQHAQHKAFTAAQTIRYKPRQQQPPSAVAQDSEQECPAPAPTAGSSSSTRPQASGSQRLDSECGHKSSSGSSSSSPSRSSGAQDATAQQPAQQAVLQQQQLPAPPQQQQQQQQPFVPGNNLSSARGSMGASQVSHRHTRSSASGTQRPPTHSPSNVCSPVIGSQGLLHAMAVGQGKQALNRWEGLPCVSSSFISFAGCQGFCLGVLGHGSACGSSRKRASCQ